MNLRRKSSNKICKRKRKSKKTQRHTQRRDLAHGTHQKKRLRAPNRERKSSTERSEEAEHERRVSQRLREAIEELQGIETLVSKPQTTRNGDGEERERERRGCLAVGLLKESRSKDSFFTTVKVISARWNTFHFWLPRGKGKMQRR